MRKPRLFAAITLTAAFLLAASAQPASAFTYKRETLPGGAVLLVRESRELPMITIRVSLPAGARAEAPEHAGLANLTAAMLTFGTSNRDASAIEKENDRLGGGVGVGADRDFATASLRVLTRDLEEGMDLLADVLRKPTFPVGELEKTRRRILGGLQRRKDRPGHLADVAIRQRIFGLHPYGRLAEGTPESVKALKRDDLVAFHRKWYGMKGAIFVFVGDITPQRAREAVLARFSGWKAAGGELPKAPMGPEPKGFSVEKIDRALSQTTVVLGNRSLNRANPDFYAARVMNYILGGGGFDSRILDNIREEKGLVYSAYSYFAAGMDTGHWRLALQTKNRSANQAIKESLAEVRRIQEKGVTDAELADAKAFITGNFATRFTTSARIAEYMLAIEQLGFPADYADRYLDLIRAVTKQQVQEAARKYIKLDKMVLIVVGNLSEAKVEF